MYELEREVLANKLLALNTIAAGKDNKEFVDQVLRTWEAYLKLTYGSMPEKGEEFDREQMMLREYEKIKHLRPKLKKNKEGKPSVVGLDENPDWNGNRRQKQQQKQKDKK